MSAEIDVLRKVLIESGVSQRHAMDVDAWHRVCMAMIDSKSPEPFRRVIFEGEGDYDELLTAINANREDGYPWFPLLSGPKISLVWIRSMAEPGGAAITGLEKMPVAVDVQVRKITEYLGVTSTYGQTLIKARRPIQEAWHRAIKEVRGPTHLQGTGAALDPVLWFMGKWGCSFCERAGMKQPISRACNICRFDDIRPGTVGNRNEDSKSDDDGLIRKIAILLDQKKIEEIERVLSEFGLDTKLSADMLRSAARTWLKNNVNKSE